MNIGGRYVTKDSLARWLPNVDNGDVPALWVEFKFQTLKGPPERLAMWGMLDTGADLCVVPSLALGILLPDDGSPPQFAEGSIGSRLNFTLASVSGIGGSVDGLRVRARIKLAGKELPGTYRVVIVANLDFPIIGREVVNRFVGMLNPFDRRVLLSNCIPMKALASFATRFTKSV